jgi:hypothetical protein
LFNNSGSTGGSANLTFNLNQNLFAFGTNTLFANATSGRVGIGTSSPTNFVHINDTAATGTGLRVDGGGGGAAIATFARTVGATGSSVDINASGNDPQIKFTRLSAGTYVIGVPSDGSLRFTSNNSVGIANDRVVITPAGNVGIGITNPTSNLHVIGTANVSANLTVGAGSAAAPAITTAGDNNTGIFFPAADTIAFGEGGVEVLRIANTSNVGIGTSLPTSNLHVIGTANVTSNLVSGNIISTGTITETVNSVQYLVASAFDVGTSPNQIPLNQYLGTMAYQDSVAVSITNLTVAGEYFGTIGGGTY